MTTTKTARTSPTTTTNIKALRLEAIFHPKFENETSDRTIRNSILTNTSASRGYVEASLKHSGSLLLWSGGPRYYSKNSTDNVFTAVGEALLRGHFARAHLVQGKEEEEEKGGRVDETESAYQHCSQEVIEKRLTLSFEIVTSVLGHHGDVPLRDYPVLLSIADRSKGTFFSTTELVTFAQKHRLPYNDVWVLRSMNSVERLFGVCDGRKERGLTEDVVEGLDGCGGVRVVGTYPHGLFQGRILEGVVVRYVPCQGNSDTEKGDGTSSDMARTNGMERLIQLAEHSKELSELVPPETPDIYRIYQGDNNPVLKLNLREIYQTFQSQTTTSTSSSSDNPFAATAINDHFRQTIHNALCTNDSGISERKTTTNVSSALLHKTHPEEIPVFLRNGGVPDIANRLLSTLSNTTNTNTNTNTNRNSDRETKRIATLIQTIERLRLPVEYKVLKEIMTTKPGKEEENGQRVRYVCIVHLRHDSSFQKYHNAIMEGEGMEDAMPLYRGFSFELVLDDNHGGGGGSDDDDDNGDGLTTTINHTISRNKNQHGETKLMLKMKFLPYMVRTFICRNGLSVLTKSISSTTAAITAFESYARRQFDKWGVSVEAHDRWMPFFRGWGRYCLQELEGRTLPSSSSVDGGSSGEDLPRLSGANYVHHYNRFEQMYMNGKFTLDNDGMSGMGTETGTSTAAPSFLGVVMIVGVIGSELHALARTIATALNVSHTSVLTDVEGQTTSLSGGGLGAVERGSGGVVCTVGIEGKTKGLHRLIQTIAGSLYLVFVGCGDIEIDEALDCLEKGDGGGDGSGIGALDSKARKKMKGIMKGWRKLGGSANIMVDVPRRDLFERGDDGGEGGGADAFVVPLSRLESVPELANAMGKIRAASDVFSNRRRPGLLFFFPVIPGSGKSTLCRTVSPASIGIVAENEYDGGDGSSGIERQVIVRVGDRVKSRYYQVVRREKLEDPSSIYFADKNAAPNAWRGLLEICSEGAPRGGGYAVPVVPDGWAFRDTEVESTVETGDDDRGVTTRNVYPYSLQCLAVCLLRVLRRPAKGHEGGLDSRLNEACTIVVKFYCLYGGLTTERILRLFRKTRSEDDGGETDGNGGDFSTQMQPCPVVVPFFSSGLLEASADPPVLPGDLDSALRDAISLYYTTEARGEKSTSMERQLSESRLRESLLSNAGFLDDLVANEEVSKTRFVEEVRERVRALEQGMYGRSVTEEVECGGDGKTEEGNVSLVSLDVDRVLIHDALKGIIERGDCMPSPPFLCNLSEKDALFRASDEKSKDTFHDPDRGGNTDDSIGERYILKTHVTLAHPSEHTQNEIRSKFGPIVGSTVEIRILALLYDARVAAMEVELADTTTNTNSGSTDQDGSNNSPRTVPPPMNDFVHITVWCAEGVRSMESNGLPAAVESGVATRVLLDQPIVVEGVLTFW